MAAEVLEFSAPHDRAQELVRVVGSADAGVGSALASALAEGRFSDLVGSVADAHPIIFRGTDEEVEGVFTLMLSLLGNCDPAGHSALVARIAEAAAAAVDAKAPLRLRVLSTVYNSVSDADPARKSAKLAVLARLIRFAADAKLLETLSPFFAGAAAWQTKWALTPEQAGALFLQISQCLEKAGAAEEAQAFLIRYLATLEGASAAAIAGAREAAKTAALNFIKAPTVSQRSNLARLAAVRALAGDATHGRLYELLDIFAHRTLAEYSAFAASHGAYLAQLGVDHSRSQETMRLLTLCSLASAKHVLPYAALASALQVPVGEVEAWVVRAVTAGLVDARMDQAAATVTVSRSVQREFTGQQWASLKERLDTWTGHVDSMLAAVQASPSRA